MPPPPGAAPPSQWGDEGWLRRVFEDHRVQTTRRQFAFRYRSAAHFVGVFRTWYGPMQQAFAGLAPDRAAALEQVLIDLANRHDRGGAWSLVVPSDYLEVVVTRR